MSACHVVVPLKRHKTGDSATITITQTANPATAVLACRSGRSAALGTISLFVVGHGGGGGADSEDEQWYPPVRLSADDPGQRCDDGEGAEHFGGGLAPPGMPVPAGSPAAHKSAGAVGSVQFGTGSMSSGLSGGMGGHRRRRVSVPPRERGRDSAERHRSPGVRRRGLHQRCRDHPGSGCGERMAAAQRR